MEVRLYSISVFYQMKFGNSHECCFIFYLWYSRQKRVKNNKQANEQNLYLLLQQSPRLQTVSWIVHS